MEYYRADKLVAELTKNENLEVSDAEAKVIGIQPVSYTHLGGKIEMFAFYNRACENIMK